MAVDVKWIKIVVNIFDDEKILLIESLPESDSIITIWFKLLCLAGKNNNHGVFLLNNRIAYTDEMFSTIFRRPINTVRLALDTFESFGMIERIDGVVTIPKWDDHQSLDALEKKREYQKQLMRERRANQKALTESNSEANCDTNSEANVSSIDKNREDKSTEEEITEDKNTNTNNLFVSVEEGGTGETPEPPTQTDGIIKTDYEAEIRRALKLGFKDLANSYYCMAKKAGVEIDVEKLKREVNDVS